MTSDASGARPSRLAQLAANPELRAVLVAHAYRGIRVQFLLRGVLLAFMAGVIGWVPPARDRGACYLVVGCYAGWTVGTALWTARGGLGPVRWMWLALLVDAVAVGSLTLVAGASAEQSWTADVLVNGLFVVPVLAAGQLRPAVTAAVALPTVAIYLSASLITRSANGEPLGSILLRTGVLAGLAVGCIGLSRVQQSRVLTIAALATDRAELLHDLMAVERSERTRLAEQLHDGALQYLLAARHDLEDVRDPPGGDPTGSLDRLDEALTRSAALLRSTVADLHPAVLQGAGLAAAVAELGRREADRCGWTFRTDDAGWTPQTPALDELLYGAARELLANVRKHAHAHSVSVRLASQGRLATLTVADDGTGLAGVDLAARLADGHVGVAALRARIAAAGGTITFAPATPSGTAVTVALPAQPVG